MIDQGTGQHSVTASSTRRVLAAREQALKLANKYCARSGPQAVVESYADKTLGGVMSDPTSIAVFACTVPNTTTMSGQASSGIDRGQLRH